MKAGIACYSGKLVYICIFKNKFVCLLNDNCLLINEKCHQVTLDDKWRFVEVFKTQLNKPPSDKVWYLLWHFFEQIGLDNLQRFLPIWIIQWSCMVIANLKVCFLRSQGLAMLFLIHTKECHIWIEWLTPSLNCSLHKKLFWMRCLNILDASPEYLKLCSSGNYSE